MPILSASQLRNLRRQLGPTVGESIAELWRAVRPSVDESGNSIDALVDASGDQIQYGGDGDNPVVDGWVCLGSYPCRISRNVAKEVEYGGQVTVVGDWRVSFNYYSRPVIFGSDRIKIAQPNWQPDKVYSVGDRVQPTNSNGLYWTCGVAGTSASTEPDWPNDPTFIDGTVTWILSGALETFEVSDPGGETTYQVIYTIGCKKIGE